MPPQLASSNSHTFSNTMDYAPVRGIGPTMVEPTSTNLTTEQDFTFCDYGTFEEQSQWDNDSQDEVTLLVQSQNRTSLHRYRTWIKMSQQCRSRSTLKLSICRPFPCPDLVGRTNCLLPKRRIWRSSNRKTGFSLLQNVNGSACLISVSHPCPRIKQNTERY